MSIRKSPSGFFGEYGVATLVAGAVTGIALPFLSDPDKCTIILSRNTPGGTLGFLSAPSAQRGAAVTTFGITSSSALDTSTVNWLAIPKNRGLGVSSDFVNTASVRKPPSGIGLAMGLATLVAGTVTVTPGIPFSSQAKVYVCARSLAGTSGKLSAPVASVNPSAGTFVINSNSAGDTSVVNWLIVDEAIKFPPSGPRIGQAVGALSGSTAFTNMNPLEDTVAAATLVFAAASVLDSGGSQGNLQADPATLDGSVVVGSSGAETSTVEVLCL